MEKQRRRSPFSYLLLWTVGLIACQPSEDTTITVSFGSFAPLAKNLLGANANLVAFDRPWDNEDLLKVTARTHVKTLRYPGGTIGNYWDWDTGALDKNVPDSLMIKWVVENNLRESSHRYTLDNLARLYHETGITPVFMLNMLSKDLAHSLRNLRKADSLGLPVKYVELGNELYFNIPFPLLRYPTPESYGDSCQAWITVLKKEFPQASFALVGNTLERHARQIDWNQRVLARCTNADALVLHSYSPSGLDGRRERRNVAPGSEGLGALKTATRVTPPGVEARQRWERELLKDEKAYANMFTTARKNLKKLDKFYLPDDMELWITEFNIRDDNSVVLHSWAQTLILTEYYFTFLGSGVALSSLHNLTGNLFGMVHTDSLTYDYLMSDTLASQPYTLSSGGMAAALFGEAMAGMEEGRVLHFDTAPALVDDRNEAFPSLKGWAFSKGSESTAIVVNYGFNQQEVSFGGKSGTLRCHSAAPSAPVIGFSSIHSSAYVFEDGVKLPPHSVSIIDFN